jgi:hypothetical protein
MGSLNTLRLKGFFSLKPVMSMFLRTLPILCALVGISGLCAQKIVNVQPLGGRTRAQIADQFKQPLVNYDVQCFRLIYTTKNTAGQPDTVSGLVAIPLDPTRTFPRLLYQHGTATTKTGVPSFDVFSGGEGERALLFAGLGFVTLMPDYLGLGVAKGFHPYVHAASEAWVAADMLRALPAFAQQYGVHVHDQLFVTGYSQGGHAAMAFHRDVETLWSHEFTVTASAPLSGPYSTGEVMRDLVLSDKVYMYPGYIPNTLISYQGVYGNLYSSFQEVIRDQYIGDITEFKNDKISLLELQVRLVAKLIWHELACRPRRLFRNEYIQAVINDAEHPLNVALRDNNVYAWAPKAPMRLYYCTEDDQVPYQNSILARDSMLARGAKNVRAQDVKPNANHSQCAQPAIDSALSFFLTYRYIGLVTPSREAHVQLLTLHPNPTTGPLWLHQLPGPGHLEVLSLDGRLRHSANVDSGGGYALDLSALHSGLYLVRFLSEGQVWQAKVWLRR